MNLAAEAATAEQRARPPFQLRGGSYTMIVLRLTEPKHPEFYKLLMDKVSQAPGFFADAPVVLDLQDLADAPPFNMAELKRRLRQHKLMPFAVQNGTDEQNRIAVNAGMIVLSEGRQAPMRTPPAAAAPSASASPPNVSTDLHAGASPASDSGSASNAGGDHTNAGEAVPEEDAAAAPAQTKVVVHPVRSGRQVYAQGGDLVVLASISPGAELIADGHIHVYGALRGRALAGITGNTEARIFCRSLDAELVSIAGYWRVREDIPDDLIGKPVQIYLDSEHVTIEPLT